MRLSQSIDKELLSKIKEHLTVPYTHQDYAHKEETLSFLRGESDLTFIIATVLNRLALKKADYELLIKIITDACSNKTEQSNQEIFNSESFDSETKKRLNELKLGNSSLSFTSFEGSPLSSALLLGETTKFFVLAELIEDSKLFKNRSIARSLLFKYSSMDIEGLITERDLIESILDLVKTEASIIFEKESIIQDVIDIFNSNASLTLDNVVAALNSINQEKLKIKDVVGGQKGRGRFGHYWQTKNYFLVNEKRDSQKQEALTNLKNLVDTDNDMIGSDSLIDAITTVYIACLNSGSHKLRERIKTKLSEFLDRERLSCHALMAGFSGARVSF